MIELTNPVPSIRRPLRPQWDTFEAYDRPHHKGIDIYPESYGDKILAAGAGIVNASGFLNDGAGWGVEIWHPSMFALTRYLHMPQGTKLVGPGTTVTARQQIGKVGCTGICNSFHLHFEVRRFVTKPDYGRPINPNREGVPLDPMRFMSLIPDGPDTTTEVRLELPVLERDFPPYTVRKGVKLLQFALNSHGMLDRTPGLNYDTATLEFDGKHGPSTDEGVRGWQDYKGLVVDGIVGAATWTTLLS